MSEIIKVSNISKKYNINQQRGGYVALRDVLANVIKGPFRFAKDKAKTIIGKNKKEEFWALKDIDFTVEEGEAVGIIGANGAGKSTLLKILTRITPPTTGEIEMKGSVASLLEVGTGFHPELTGRENIFLNGAILGMRKEEIEKKFDAIVEFSGIGKFIDMPVKRYSSGMYVRLAFSIAAHLEPDILLIDEVLAVGDIEFQKKCLGKMDEVTKKAGRTILFVSHNMGAIERLCSKVIVLKNGKIELYGITKECIKTYLNSSTGLLSEKKWENLKFAPGDNVAKIKRVFSHKENGEISNIFDITKKIGITFEYEAAQGGYSFTHGLNVFNEDGINVFNSHDIKGSMEKDKMIGIYSATVWIPGNLLAEGTFSIGIALFKQTPFLIHAYEQNVLSLKVIDNMDGKSTRGQYTDGFPGIVRPLLNWETKKII